MAEVLDDPGLRNRVHVFDDRFHTGELLALATLEPLIPLDTRTLDTALLSAVMREKPSTIIMPHDVTRSCRPLKVTVG